MNQTDEEFHKAVGFFRASGLSESEAHAKAEQVMEDAIQERSDDHESRHLFPVQ